VYVRFVVHLKDADSGKRKGLFQALFEARRAGLLYDYEEERIKDILKWVDQNLDKPTSFSRSSKPRVFNTAIISWYKDKDTAKEHMV